MPCIASGSSPLTRGKRAGRFDRSVNGRLIPAHAGKTGPSRTPVRLSGAHPRSRGENPPDRRGPLASQGSSPLTRGKPPIGDRLRMRRRLIPAHAGKTPRSRSNARASPAHPRSRGENSTLGDDDGLPCGSSPLTRGKLRHGTEPAGQLRLIPAHAGKTLPDLRFYCADRSDLGNP